jgi:hypothetical protein
VLYVLGLAGLYWLLMFYALYFDLKLFVHLWPVVGKVIDFIINVLISVVLFYGSWFAITTSVSLLTLSK